MSKLDDAGRASYRKTMGNIEDYFDYDETRDVRVFKGTTVPIVYFWDSLINDETISGFLARFPELDKQMVLSVFRCGSFPVCGLV